MAFYNPNKISFQPNAQVIQSAGAIGGAMKEASNSLYEKQMKRQEAQLLQEQFNRTKQRDIVGDEQWGQTFKANQDWRNYQIDNNADDWIMKNEKIDNDEAQRVITNQLNADRFNETKRANGISETRATNKANALKQTNYINGIAKMNQFPDLAEQIGAKRTTTEFGTPQEQTFANPLLASIMGGNPQSTSPVPQIDMQQGMSVPTFENKTTYNNDIIRQLGASGLKIPTEGGTANTTDMKNYNAYADSLTSNGGTPEPFHSWYQKVLNRKNLGKGINDADIMIEREAGIAALIGVQPYELKDIDINKLPPKQQKELMNYAITSDNAYRSRLSNKQKDKMVGYARMAQSVKDLSESMSSKDSGLINRTLNVANNYLGFGDADELARKAFTQSNYADFRNTMLKIVSGASVPASEAERFQQAFGVLMQTDEVAMKKLQTQTGLMRAELLAVKQGIGSPTVFNIRYGDTLRAVDNAFKLMGGNTQKQVAFDGSANNQATNYTNLTDEQLTELYNKEKGQ